MFKSEINLQGDSSMNPITKRTIVLRVSQTKTHGKMHSICQVEKTAMSFSKNTKSFKLAKIL